MRQDETQWPDNVRGVAKQHLPFLQAFAHQPEFVMLQIAQTAMNQLGTGAGGVLGKIVFFHQHNRQAAACSITGDTRAVDSAPDDKKVVRIAHNYLSPRNAGPG